MSIDGGNTRYPLQKWQRSHIYGCYSWCGQNIGRGMRCVEWRTRSRCHAPPRCPSYERLRQHQTEPLCVQRHPEELLTSMFSAAHGNTLGQCSDLTIKSWKKELENVTPEGSGTPPTGPRSYLLPSLTSLTTTKNGIEGADSILNCAHFANSAMLGRCEFMLPVWSCVVKHA